MMLSAAAADLENFTWGGQRRGKRSWQGGRDDGTWESLYVNRFNKTNTKTLLNLRFLIHNMN